MKRAAPKRNVAACSCAPLALLTEQPLQRERLLLYGSLALTGKGHATDRAILLGLSGHVPASIDPDDAEAAVQEIRSSGRLRLAGGRGIAFTEASDLRFLARERLEFHSNAMTFLARDAACAELVRRTYYSVGGGAILTEDGIGRNAPAEAGWDVPHVFRSGAELLALAATEGKSIAQFVRENEEAAMRAAEISVRLSAIRAAMAACIDRGIRSDLAELPRRTAREAARARHLLGARQERALAEPLTVIDWINPWAPAVNEENAAGGKVVTPPTNGAAGIVPTVLR